MQKKFLVNLAILLLLNLLVKPFWMLGIEVAVQNQVGNVNYGEYFALFNFSFLFNIILDLGLTNFNNKNIAQNNHLLTKHFSSLFVIKLILALVYILGALVIGQIIRYDARLTKLLLLLGFNQFLISMVLYLRSNLQGLHLFKADSLVSILDRLIMILVCAVILWGHMFSVRMDIMLFAYIQTASYFITAFIAFLMVVGKTDTLKLKLSYPFTLMILKKSFPFAILTLLMTFYNRVDAVMLERILPAHNTALAEQIVKLKVMPGYLREPFHTMIDRLDVQVTQNGADQAGIYAKAFRLLDAANMIAYLFSVILLPTFSRMIKFKESVEALVKLSFTLIITPALVVAIGCCFYSHELMDLLYKDQVEQSAVVFGPLMCCFVAISTNYIFGTLLTANGNLLYLNILAGFAMLINISLNLLLIPNFQAPGSAYVSLTTQAVMAVAQVLIVQRVFKFRVNYRLLTTLGVFIIGVIGINYVSKMFFYHFSYHDSSHHWFLNFGAMVIACVLYAFLIGQLNLKSIFRMAKYG
jgi:O-antigen/teichoic acid export membrane protein